MDIKLIRDQAERRATRKSLVRTADRSEKIRTYNYPQVRYSIENDIIYIYHEEQNRVTDHRLGKGNMVSCEAMMEGDGLEMLIDELREKYLKELLREIIDQN
jgi:peptide chain release factor 1